MVERPAVDGDDANPRITDEAGSLTTGQSKETLEKTPRELDATVPEGVPLPSLGRLEEKKYDVERSTHEARKLIAYWLLGLLTLLVVGAFVGLLGVITDGPSFEQLKALVELILGPIITLVSAATGFYFGAKSVSSKE
ncbi:MAG: hypothetical protein JNK68_16260 [Betaproteobacteria bacterium]|nr:hypothetical protein [Betaproteobacteria bacterium]